MFTFKCPKKSLGTSYGYRFFPLVDENVQLVGNTLILVVGYDVMGLRH